MKNIYALIGGLWLALLFSATGINAAQTDITGPAGSGSFGQTVTTLPNGNIVVTDPFYDIPAGAVNVGAVYLYDGATLALISTLTGSTTSDQVGNNGVTVLTNGNFVVRSQPWNGARGAVTWCSATTGCSGTVSSANSLVGSTASDQVGNGVTVLTNGNYVVRSQSWDNPSPATVNVGAATWGSGTSGVSGVISSANSLIGSTASDFLGSGGIVALTNGNYVVLSPNWDNSPTANVGAATWGNGAGGTVGVVSNTNSLVGSTASDQIGSNGMTALTNGNYVVLSPFWDNPSPAAADVGAVTWGSGAGGTIGTVSSANSLVGSTTSDQVGGGGGVTALTNGNYVVVTASWDNPSPLIANVGAVTWGNGTSGSSGAVSSANSLIGSTVNDTVGGNGVTALTNGNYVVSSGSWNNPSPAISHVGAATWGNGASGTAGVVSSANSLIGSTANDNVGINLTALTNGNYVVCSGSWDNPSPLVVNVGAVTWGSGTTGTVGTVSTGNSLVGSTTDDFICSGSVTALTNGNYVIASPNWNNPSPAITDGGAITWVNGASSTSGVISSANSLIGSTTNDLISGSVTALTNGNYVVRSPFWDNPSPATTDVGAATWGSGTSITSGVISSANSLVGSTANDQVGSSGVTALTNGNYVVRSPNWDNPSPATTDVGAATWGSGASITSGAVSSANSLVGSTASDQVGSGSTVTALANGNYVVRSVSWDNPSLAVVDATAFTFGDSTGVTNGAITSGVAGGNSVVGTVASGTSPFFAFDAARNRLVVGRGASNAVSILSFTTTAISDGDLNNAANWDNGVPNGLVTGIIPSGRAMTISSVMSVGQIQVQCGGSLTGGSSSAYVVGSIRKDFCAAANEAFTYPLGDINNYSPLAVSNTNGTGSLTAAVTDTFLPGLPSAKSLSRYWSLTGAGITTDLTFNYTNGDINGTEANYRLFKRSSSTNLTVQVPAALLNTAANTLTVTGVSQFSDWSAADAPLNPTAANVSVSGRVSTHEGGALRNAMVYLTDSRGNAWKRQTGSFGNFTFEGIEAGATVTLTVVSKRFRFAPLTMQVNDNVADLDLSSLP